jgi:hypothetical protein
MWTDELRVCDEVLPGAWIAPRLTGEIGTVTGTVPSGYPAYVRICHPAPDQGRAPVSWAEVARTTGRQVHALMQWHALVGSPDSLNMRGSLWRGGNPARGDLAPEVLGPLCALLGDHTGAVGHCYFGLWEGWGWVDGVGVSAVWDSPSDVAADAIGVSEVQVEPGFSPDELSRPRMELPYRNYVLLEGPLSAALQIGQSPNLFWPADRAWCVASEIDFDSTLLGGTVELIEAILDFPPFDAWPVGPADSLTYDADQINKVN